MKKLISLLLLFTFGLSSCEKDDICDANTPTTPRLVITFYDIANPTKTKNVSNLKVIGDGMEQGIVFNESLAVDDPLRYVTSGSSVMIPLKINDNTTTFKFIYNSLSETPTTINTDVIKFNYTTQNVYVSRACGFKTIFQLTNVAPFVHTDPDGDTFWMTEVDLENPNIELENETHIKVYF
ncbi:MULTISPECIES: DUF6452 family protein [Flavobacterium]|jgi:hypothetical protein|uniref:Lipoprotein n=1 Tax=Flavobacterium anhuiense TaxID=459526 RepID=A0AAC9CYG0_9FLAO|nr:MULTISPECIES: DUF6452 family protein [Flavobacterium]AOC93311.1 hypothetical protein BB050_00155 [Flavobacterium anhuiense]EJG02998.1 hypothetical protein FF52_02360 [Flavobacterium sp. F52]URM35151.1 DUF6452 family protein [Flavobacterium anhuiense]SCY19588.1 hypothetical protein SAMN02927916_1431 [Flavobacterium anhuiense]